MDDFWKVIVQYKVEQVVMLCSLIENGRVGQWRRVSSPCDHWISVKMREVLAGRWRDDELRWSENNAVA